MASAKKKAAASTKVADSTRSAASTKDAKKIAASSRALATGGGADFLARILADPADVEARLVYADALIEAGDARGTFIAQASALAAMDPLDPKYAPLLASTQRIEAAHARAWLAGYVERSKLEETHAGGRIPLDRQLNAVFEDGFLHRVAMTPEAIAKEWPLLRAREPIAGVELLVGEALDRAYRDLKEPQAFTVLKVSPESWFTASSVGNVLAWGMPGLVELDLSGCDVGATDAKLLANEETDLAESFDDYVAPPPFAPGQLKRLVLRNCGLGDAGARSLFAAAHLTGLEDLDVSQCRITNKDTLAALRAAPALKRLTRLSLAGNNDLGPQLAALAGWEVVPRLEHLALPQTTTAESLKALFPRPSKALRALDLSSAKALLKTPPAVTDAAEALVSLDLGGTSTGDDGWTTLLAAPSLHRLVHLHANGCSLSDDAVAALVKSRLRSLVTLDLSSNKLTDASLAMLAAWPGLEHVSRLRLGNNKKLTTAGYDALIAADGFRPSVLDVGKSEAATRLRERFGAAVLAR